jgi:ankyrin repeat protein
MRYILDLFKPSPQKLGRALYDEATKPDKRDEERMLELLEQGALRGQMQGDRAVAILSAAAAQGYVRAVRALIKNGVDVNGADATGKTPLMYAARHMEQDCVAALLKADARPNATDKYGRTPLMHLTMLAPKFIQGGDGVACAQLLLSHGAKTEVQDSQRKTALMYAHKSGHRDVAALFGDELKRRHAQEEAANLNATAPRANAAPAAGAGR